MPSRIFGVLIAGLWLGLGLSTSPLAAQQQYTFGVYVGAAGPTGDLKDILGTGGGGAVSIGGMVSNSVMLKADLGYWSFGAKSLTVEGQPIEVEGAVIPFRVGIRKFWGESKRFFTGPTIGFYAPGRDLDGLETHFGFSPQVGIRFPMGDGAQTFEIMAEYHTIVIGDENPLTQGPRTFFDNDKVNFFTVGVGFTVGSVGN